jgi:hypothetical protein
MGDTAPDGNPGSRKLSFTDDVPTAVADEVLKQVEEAPRTPAPPPSTPPLPSRPLDFPLQRGATGFGLVVTEPGHEVLEVTDNSPAQAAGLAVGDVLMAVDGQDLGENTLEAALSHSPVKTTFSVRRFESPAAGENTQGYNSFAEEAFGFESDVHRERAASRYEWRASAAEAQDEGGDPNGVEDDAPPARFVKAPSQEEMEESRKPAVPVTGVPVGEATAATDGSAWLKIGLLVLIGSLIMSQQEPQ